MATATPYISGMKKPLNMIEAPVYPDIKKGPPRFVWSRKHWNVDTGATIRDAEPFTQFFENAVLAQSRDYNKTVYGQSSHKDIVNAAFRPPLLSYYEDIGPLTRVPATIHAIIPHINPGTAGHDGGTNGYVAKNERAADVMGALSDRIQGSEWRPTFFAPIEVPQDNSVLPDLETKLPPVSAHAGWIFPVNDMPVDRNIDLGDDKLQAIPIKSGYNGGGLLIDGGNGFENYQVFDNRPMYSASAGMNTPITINGETSTIELFDNRPSYSASAGMNVPMQIDGETPTAELFYNRPQVSADAGMNIPIQIDGETSTIELFDNRPSYSASAGMNVPIQIDGETPTAELFEKLGGSQINVLNPGSETGYMAETSVYANQDEYIQENRPSYSYQVPSEEPVYRSRNSENHQPHFRQRLQPVKSYGQISQSGGAIPRSGIDTPRQSLGGRRKIRYEVPKKQSRYRF